MEEDKLRGDDEFCLAGAVRSAEAGALESLPDPDPPRLVE
jgi:hypothetical protein